MNQPEIEKALRILAELKFPREQQNERSALCLLALLHLTPGKSWAKAEAPMIGITPIMDFIREHYGKNYAPNTRETVRRQTMHQFMDAGFALYNPDEPGRPVNSPKAVYQIAPEALELVKHFDTKKWGKKLSEYLSIRKPLAEKYARRRELKKIPVKIKDSEIFISPGEHSQLIKEIIEEFGPNFAPGSVLIYAGDTGEKWGYFDEKALSDLGVQVDSHGKMPDVVLYFKEKNWLLLIEAVTSHGPVNPKRHEELAALFQKSSAGLVYVTAFPTKRAMARYLSDISWETEVWIAENPTHLIHFDGKRFLGPYVE